MGTTRDLFKNIRDTKGTFQAKMITASLQMEEEIFIRTSLTITSARLHSARTQNHGECLLTVMIL